MVFITRGLEAYVGRYSSIYSRLFAAPSRQRRRETNYTEYGFHFEPLPP